MDVLANVLAVTQLASTVFCESELLSPWGLDIRNQQKATMHLVRRGTCWLGVAGRKDKIRLSPGDVVLIAPNVQHSLSDAPEQSLLPVESALASMRERLAANSPASHTDTTLLLCAAYQFQQAGEHPVLQLLPAVIHLHQDESLLGHQLANLIRLLVAEAPHQHAGSELVMPRLIDCLFVYILRAWLAQQAIGTAGWFGALRDPQVGKAIQLIHAAPAKAWTVASLAQQAALSRAAFARRFTELVGEPPLSYITRWRMNLAAKQLRSGRQAVETIAHQVGYESATSFSKAFQRHLNMSPSEFRAQAAPAQTN